MQKTGIMDKKRKLLIIGLTLVVMVISVLLAASLIINKTEERTVKKGSLTYKSETLHEVVLKQDTVYNPENIDIGNTYVTRYVENLAAKNKYEFAADIDLVINGMYYATVIIENITNDKKVIWSKEYALQQAEGFQAAGKTGQLEEEIVIPLNKYLEFVGNINANLKVPLTSIIKVTFTMDFEAEIGGQTIKDSILTTMEFPVNSNYLEIGGNPKAAKEKVIEETVLVQQPKDIKIIVLYIGLFVILLISLLYTLIYTKGIHISSQCIELMDILKKYSERIVTINPKTYMSFKNAVLVKTFRDLLLIADELEKPVLYIPGDERVVFYICEDSSMYFYEISLTPSKVGA